jgi:uncharacterized protein YecT (DUF1311 family)
MRKLVLLFGLVASATGLSVRAQDVAAGCQGVNLEIVECAGRRADATGGMQDRIYHIVMDALIAGGDDRVDPLAEQFFGFFRGSLPKSRQQWTQYRDAQCEVAQELYFGGSGAAVGGAQCVFELTRERIKFLRHVMDVIRDESKLCKADNAKCSLPPEPQ